MNSRSVLLIVAAVVGVVSAHAESPEPTVLVPEPAVSTDSGGLYATIGGGPSDETDRLQGHSPVLAFTLGGSLPIKGRAYVDIGMYLSSASYHAEPSLTGWGNDAELRTFAFTASGRGGYTGRKAAVFASAGIGLAYVTLTEGLQLYGAYSPPLDATVAPVLTVAGSFEAPTRTRSRFLAEVRYSWIHADFGGNSGGSLNVGGPALLLGWKGAF